MLNMRYFDTLDIMSGHSKWSTIKHRKGAQDAKRGKVFTKIIREIIVATREGGGDPESNNRLRAALASARVANMPKETIQRAIERGSGVSQGESYHEIIYEGYGPQGVALIVKALTDNKNRTAADVRSIFNKNGGSLGESGSVSYLFEMKGVIVINCDEQDADSIADVAIDCGVDDFESADEYMLLYCPPKELHAVTRHLEQEGISYERANISMLPQSPIAVAGDAAHKALKLIEQLEDLDDIQEVYSNLEINDEEQSA